MDANTDVVKEEGDTGSVAGLLACSLESFGQSRPLARGSETCPDGTLKWRSAFIVNPFTLGHVSRIKDLDYMRCDLFFFCVCLSNCLFSFEGLPYQLLTHRNKMNTFCTSPWPCAGEVEAFPTTPGQTAPAR